MFSFFKFEFLSNLSNRSAAGLTDPIPANRPPEDKAKEFFCLIRNFKAENHTPYMRLLEKGKKDPSLEAALSKELYVAVSGRLKKYEEANITFFASFEEFSNFASALGNMKYGSHLSEEFGFGYGITADYLVKVVIDPKLIKVVKATNAPEFGGKIELLEKAFSCKLNAYNFKYNLEEAKQMLMNLSTPDSYLSLWPREVLDMAVGKCLNEVRINGKGPISIQMIKAYSLQRRPGAQVVSTKFEYNQGEPIEKVAFMPSV